MTRAFSTYKAFSAKRPLLRSSIIAAVALGAILVSAGPAAAQESGNGTFTVGSPGLVDGQSRRPSSPLLLSWVDSLHDAGGE